MEEGLSSTDVDVIKAARGTAKGKVTRNANTLESILTRDGDQFLLEDIDEERAEKVYENLNASHEEFQELHERYNQHVVIPASTEALVTEVDKNYFNEENTKFMAAYRLFTQFKRAKKLSDSTLDVRALKEALDGRIAAAKSVLDSTDANIKKTARTVKNELRQSLNAYSSKADEVQKLEQKSKSSTEEKPSVMVGRSEIVQEVENIYIELEAIALSSSATSAPSGTEKSIVKLQKLTCPKFSGVPRDFGQFKRDFDQIVKVEGRADVEIGSNLRDAIPEKHKHLISHLDTSNHIEMMSILEKKFGDKSLVVQDIISQVEKMKVVTNDKMFIEFVEKLQKVKLDLDTLKLTSEIANASCMGKIEKKLPLCISTDWWKLVIEKKLNAGSSEERFLKLMEFLVNAKERVEWQTTSLNDSGSGSVVKAVTNCVTGSISLPSNAGGGKDRNKRQWNPCLACNVDGATDVRSICHAVETCAVWNSLQQKEKEQKVKCLKHPFKSDHTTANCTVKGKLCKHCKEDTHHFLLCPKKKVKTSSNAAKIKTSSAHVNGRQPKVPILLQAQFVLNPHGKYVGALLDLASSDDYVTHSYAKKHKLKENLLSWK